MFGVSVVLLYAICDFIVFVDGQSERSRMDFGVFRIRFRFSVIVASSDVQKEKIVREPIERRLDSVRMGFVSDFYSVEAERLQS